MFHLKVNPRPPSRIGRDTPGQAVEFLGDRHRAVAALLRHGIEVAQEADGLQVLPAAVDVGNPLACLAAVIAIQHRGDRIDPQAVNVEILQPVHAAGDQEALHLPPAEIVDEGVPVLVETLLRSACSNSGVPSKRARPCASVGKCPGTQSMITPMPARWQVSTKRAKPSAGPNRAGRREQAERLIAPRPAERILRDRHQLDMREAQLHHIGHQPIGQIVPTGDAAMAGAEPDPACTS